MALAWIWTPATEFAFHIEYYYTTDPNKKDLEKDPVKIPSPSRDEMMSMLLKAWESLQIDIKREFKSLFVTNSLDGSEDYLVSNKLFSLIGEEMKTFRKELMSSKFE